MKSFTVESENKAVARIDSTIYSKAVVAKVVYWLSRDFTIMQTIEGEALVVSLESHGIIDWDETKKRMSQMLIDYQMREVIAAETKDIRNILFIKAFANVEELLADEKV